MQTSALTAYQDPDFQSRYKHIKRLSRVQKSAILNINENFFTVGLAFFFFIIKFVTQTQKNHLVQYRKIKGQNTLYSICLWDGVNCTLEMFISTDYWETQNK